MDCARELDWVAKLRLLRGVPATATAWLGRTRGSG